MINNKQVNIWRGDQPPPTLFHVWIYKNQQILLYNGTEWVVFVNDPEIADQLIKLQEQVNVISQDLENLSNNTINNKAIKDNPVLNGDDILLNKTGEFINSEKSVSDNIVQLDRMFVTQIIA